MAFKDKGSYKLFIFLAHVSYLVHFLLTLYLSNTHLFVSYILFVPAQLVVNQLLGLGVSMSAPEIVTYLEGYRLSELYPHAVGYLRSPDSVPASVSWTPVDGIPHCSLLYQYWYIYI